MLQITIHCRKKSFDKSFVKYIHELNKVNTILLERVVQTCPPKKMSLVLLS